MKTLDAGFLAAIQATVTQPLHLVEIGFATPLRLSSRGDVSWNDQVWVGRDVGVDGLGSDGAGNAQATLTLGNHDNAMSAYLLNERIADKVIKIYAAWLDAADALHVDLAYQGAGGGARVGVDIAVITVVPSGSALLHAPRLMISAASGFSRLRPAGYKFSWNGVDIILERRSA